MYRFMTYEGMYFYGHTQYGRYYVHVKNLGKI